MAGSTKKSSKKPAAKAKVAPKAKAPAKKPAVVTKKAAANPSPKKAVTKVSSKAAAKPAAKTAKAPASKAVAVKAPPKPTKLSAKDDRKQKAMAALEAAMKENEPETEEEDFDPEAFFAAQAAAGVDMAQLRPHIMRKERVDMNLMVRFRLPNKGPLVFSAELINLSKGGLCLRTKDAIPLKTQIRIEIPLPHTSELFAINAEVIWTAKLNGDNENPKFPNSVGLTFCQMSLAKTAVISQFIQQRRDEIIMAKIGLDRFNESAPVAGLD